MKLNKLTPLLWTNKLQETIDFYTKTLNFICTDRNDEWGWAAMHNDKVEIMIAKPNEHTFFEKSAFTGSFYFNVDQADELWLALKDKVEIVYPIETFDWGMREFAIYDNNGYILQFGQNID